jgi:hypothetical protein
MAEALAHAVSRSDNLSGVGYTPLDLSFSAHPLCHTTMFGVFTQNSQLQKNAD